MSKIFTGMVLEYECTLNTVPPGWLPCDGRLLEKDGPYNELYLAIGMRYGGNETQFRLPDRRGTVPYGAVNDGDLGVQEGEARYFQHEQQIDSSRLSNYNNEVSSLNCNRAYPPDDSINEEDFVLNNHHVHFVIACTND